MGTIGLVERNADFVISAALLDQGRPVVAAVFNPLRDVLSMRFSVAARRRTSV